MLNPIAYYVLVAVLAVGVLVGIYLMSKVKTSVIGNGFSALCMLLAIILTLVQYDIFDKWVLYPCMIIGAVIGIVWAYKVKMIQMPQLVALFNGVGGLASALVAMITMLGITAEGYVINEFVMVTAALALAVGSVTFIGSLIAAGKLHKILPQKAVVIKGHQALSIITLLLTLGSIVMSAFFNVIPAYVSMIVCLVVSTLFGILFAIRVGGADMPVVISLLNSLSGVAAGIAGIAIGDYLLVAVGGIVGASGLLLTQIMCKSMNRKLSGILFGTAPKSTAKTEVKVAVETKEEKEEPEIIEKKTDGEILKEAKEVIIVPGYGMALAQAQHLVKQLADKLVASGVKVKYAIHPVAGRMPGHMNVLLCEADVDYEDLYQMDDINDDFVNADVVVVVGANDVINPAAREAEGTPIYGMPVLNVDKAKHVIICNYDLKPGYAGVDNPLYSKGEGVSLRLGNATDTLQQLLGEMDNTAAKPKQETVNETKVVSDIEILKKAKEVIIVPGYGMALAQAQHLVKQLADKLVASGVKVKYAIHPVAGRMPGHMNVLLCEADVDYEDLYQMDDINDDFVNADVVVVVGANDVINPAAREAEGTPIYGMPVLNVDKAKHVIICNYDLKPGYAGVDNPLYSKSEGVTLRLGNATDTLQELLNGLNSETTEETVESKVESKAETTVSPSEKLKEAKEVIIVPGYGMALAQAQHLVKQLADKLVASGVKVKYAIHPVAGRMPGHMNVLLCEADVDYEDLYQMDDINDDFVNADVVVVVGANDVINPAAREAEGTPIYGMPVLNVDKAKHVIICNYDLKPGYAGVDNPLYTDKEKVTLLLGDASETLSKLIAEI